MLSGKRAEMSDLKRRNDLEDREEKRQRKDEHATMVAQHYNARPQKSGTERQFSPIFQLKAFNNYIKSILISRYVRPSDRVLDICFGKGGDLLKYKNSRIKELVGVDIAEISIEHAKERYNTGRFRFLAKFIVMDCFANKLTELPDWDPGFNVVSVQFSLHYAFESEAKARRLLENVSDNLLPKHYFIGTIPNCEKIKERVTNEDSLDFGNPLYQIRFESVDKFEAFGHKYWFQLEDAIDDLPEFLVDFDVLTSLAEEYNLKLRMKKGFHEFFEQNRDEPLLKRMRVLDSSGSIEPNQWEIAGLYIVFAFEKIIPEEPSESKEDEEENGPDKSISTDDNTYSPQQQPPPINILSKSTQPSYTKDSVLGEAYSILHTQNTIRKMLKDCRDSYLGINRHIGGTFMTEREKDNVDEQVHRFISTSIKRIELLENKLGEASLSEDQQTHYQSIVAYLRTNLQKISHTQQEHQQTRTKNLFQSDILPEVLDRGLKPSGPATEHFNEQERKLLENENKTLMHELMGMEAELDKAESSLLHIAELQNQLEMYLTSQAEDVDRLYKESEETTDKVLRGNFILHKITQQGITYRNYMIFFFLLMSFVLLFLHWYD